MNLEKAIKVLDLGSKGERYHGTALVGVALHIPVRIVFFLLVLAFAGLTYHLILQHGSV